MRRRAFPASGISNLHPGSLGEFQNSPGCSALGPFPNSSVVYDAHLGFWEYPVVLPVLFPSVS